MYTGGKQRSALGNPIEQKSEEKTKFKFSQKELCEYLISLDWFE